MAGHFPTDWTTICAIDMLSSSLYYKPELDLFTKSYTGILRVYEIYRSSICLTIPSLHAHLAKYCFRTVNFMLRCETVAGV